MKQTIISANELSYSYDQHNNVLQDVSFSVDKGEIFGLLGPNGAGKSTLQKILIGIIGDYLGKAVVAGCDTHAITSDFYQMIGVLFEQPYLYDSMSAIENLIYFSSFFDKRRLSSIEELLNKVNLKKCYRNRPIKTYSKGMRQRTSIARLLLNDPDIVFIDEPISGLDPAGAVLVKGIIKDLQQQGKTVLLTTHNMFVADQLCDRVAFINGGSIVAIDSPDNFKAANREKQLEVTYRYNGEISKSVITQMQLIKSLPFAYDEIIAIHSRELSLEDIFVQLTGRDLS